MTKQQKSEENFLTSMHLLMTFETKIYEFYAKSGEYSISEMKNYLKYQDLTPDELWFYIIYRKTRKNSADNRKLYQDKL